MKEKSKIKRILIVALSIFAALILSFTTVIFVKNATRSAKATADAYATLTSSYWYTDFTKRDTLLAGAGSDVTDVELTGGEHGSQGNPYVIDSTDTWQHFVNDMATDSTKGVGKYFVLSNDLDFKNGTIDPVAEFKGTFYGMGHSIMNAQIADNGTGLNGLFTKITQATTIADINLKNCTFDSKAHTTGMLAGYINVDVTISNCYVEGSITVTTDNLGNSPDGTHAATGAVIGYTTSNNLNLYKCATDVTISSTYAAGGGHNCISGMAGIAQGCASINFYDCFNFSKITVKDFGHNYVGSLLGRAMGCQSINFYDSISIGTIPFTSSAYSTTGCFLSAYSSTALNTNNCFAYVNVNGMTNPQFCGWFSSQGRCDMGETTYFYSDGNTTAGADYSGAERLLKADALWEKVNNTTNGLNQNIWNKSNINYSPSSTDVDIFAKPVYNMPLRVPQDIKVTYTGKEFNLRGATDSIEKEIKAQSWYDSSVYGDDSKIEITYPTGTVKDVDSYPVTVKLLETSGTTSWADAATSTSGNERSFNFIIEQAELPVSVTKDSVTQKPKLEINEGKAFGDDTADKLSEIVRLKYTGGNIPSAQYTCPTKVGSYKATAEIDTSKAGAGNYKLANPAPSVTFDIGATTVTVPNFAGSATKTETYKGSAPEIALDGMSDKVTVTCPTGGNITYDETTKKFTVNKAGTYNVTLNLADTDQTVWDDTTGGTGERTLTITVERMSVTLPFIGVPSADYTGEDIDFTISGTSDNAILKLDGNTLGTAATVKNAGDYTIKATLKDADNMCWGSDQSQFGEKEIKFTVTKATLTVGYVSDYDGGKWEWTVNDAPTVTVTPKGVKASDSVKLVLTYTGGTAGSTPTAAGTSTYENNVLKVAMNKQLRGTYTLSVAFATGTDADGTQNGNYEFDGATWNFTVTGDSASFTQPTWQYSADGGSTWQDLAAGAALPYTGKDYTVRIKEDDAALQALGVKIDVGYVADGFANGYKNQTYKAVSGTDGYTTSVRIAAYDSSYDFTPVTCSISWKIAKAAIDLSKVEWDYSSPLTYNGKTQEIKLKNVPAVLNITYKNNSYKNAGKYEAEIVGITVIDAEKDNYEKPDINNLPFAKTLQWEIKPVAVKILWEQKPTTQGGNEYLLPFIDGYEDVLEYAFYESDKDGVRGNKLANGTADIVVNPGEEKYYLVEVSIKNTQSNNYEFEGDAAARVYKFSTGKDKTKVELELSGSGLEYDGQPKEAKFEIKSGILADGLVITYFKKGEIAPLDGAPTDAGEYTVKVSLTENDSADNYIPTSTFDFVIKKATLDISGIKWNYTQAFEYGTENGEPIVYTVELEGLPDYLKGIVKYTGNTSSIFGKKMARVEFEGFDENNYEALVFPDGFKNELDWEIGLRLLEKPTVKHPRSYHTGEEQVAEIEGFDGEYMELSGELKGTDIGEYKVTVHLKDAKYVRWADNSSADVELTFTIISAGEPLDPDNPDKPDDPVDPTPVDPVNPNNPDNPNIDQNEPNNNTTDGDGFKLPDGFPLWQVIVGGLSIILIAAFIAKICSNVSNTKEYKQKTAGVYAGAMINGMLFGISNTWWTVIALSLAGVALILFIVMLATGSAMKKARREEQRHHDEEMKMLMMMMHGNKGGSSNYSPAVDVEEIVTRVVTALLPTMQQAAAQIPAGTGDYDDSELRHRIEELESKDDGFNDLVEDYEENL